MSQVEFERNGGFLNFITKFDRYADPINLSYNHQKVYKTCHGGLLTVVALIIVAYVLVSNIIDIVGISNTETTRSGPQD